MAHFGELDLDFFLVHKDHLDTEDKLSLEFLLGGVYILDLFELQMMDTLFQD